MKILQINQTHKLGSTGKIMADINDVIQKNGHESYMLCAYSLEQRENLYVMDKGRFPLSSKRNILRMRLTGINGYMKKHATQKAMEWVDTIKPDVIHLHNIHGDWIHLETLFAYIKEHEIPVVWTLHDCWAFTGRCSHFELFGCEKWKTGCYGCKNKKVYPISYAFDFSRHMWKDKKDWFTGVDNMRIVTPSKWLKQYVDMSFLGKNPVTVIPNGIDVSYYHPVPTRSKYLSGCDKKIVLGVASSWSDTKGYSDFLKLDQLLPRDQYQVVMVGLNSRQMKALPKSIIGIMRTQNAEELIELYSNADVFVNLTYQDNYPTTNLEAISCGTPAITYRTGGSPESMISDEYVVETGNVKAVADEIISVVERPIDICKFREHALSYFDKFEIMKKYIQLYESIVGK